MFSPRQAEAEKNCHLLKHSMRCVPDVFKPNLSDVAQTLVTAFKQHQHSTYLYAAEILARTYANDPENVPVLTELFNQLSTIGLQSLVHSDEKLEEMRELSQVPWQKWDFLRKKGGCQIVRDIMKRPSARFKTPCLQFSSLGPLPWWACRFVDGHSALATLTSCASEFFVSPVAMCCMEFQVRQLHQAELQEALLMSENLLLAFGSLRVSVFCACCVLLIRHVPAWKGYRMNSRRSAHQFLMKRLTFFDQNYITCKFTDRFQSPKSEIQQKSS